MENGTEPTDSGRSRRRRNVVGSSAHREEYVRLLKAGWSSISLERLAAIRYGEDIPARTFRQYKQRHKIEAEEMPLQQWEKSEILDVVTARATLIRMQQARLKVEVGLEIGENRGMNKLLSTTRHEIDLLSKLLDAHKSDLQDLGLMPKAGESIDLNVGGGVPSEGEIPAAKTLGELLGVGDDPKVQSEMARVLHMASKGRVDPEAGSEAG